MVFLSKKKLFFFMQNFSFSEAGCSFWYLFLSFFMQNFSFLGGWEVFLSKKKNTLFYAKLKFLRGWMLFFIPFFVIFV